MFIDESALLLSPYLRRTWSPCGCRPVVVQRIRHRQKLSIIAGLVIRARRRRVRFVFRLHRDCAVDGPKAVAFLRQVGLAVSGPIIVVWDRLNAHRSKVVQAFLARRPRFQLEYLPPYAPELNPTEYAWGWLKTNPLANYVPKDAAELARTARRQDHQLKHRARLLWSFIDHSPLPLRHK
ncbi:MAG: transposase [Opitutaceae bacterium]|nr:transposase [Opitutaceae bacterium]